jgi:hypothetical protein
MATLPSWKHSDVFPIIARIIGEEYQRHHRYITAHEISLRLVEDEEAQAIISQAHQQVEEQSLEWLATNMVSWFSQRITVGESEWQCAFERAKVDRQWAYIPRSDNPVERR